MSPFSLAGTAYYNGREVNLQRFFKQVRIKKPLLLIVLINCATLLGAQQNWVDTVSIMKSIDSLGRVVQKAHETHDTNLLASTWAKDGILILAGSPAVYGRANIVNMIAKMTSLPPDAVLKMNIIEARVLNPEWVYVLGVDSISYPVNGKKPVTETFNFLVLVRKTEEGWQTYRETLIPNQQVKLKK